MLDINFDNLQFPMWWVITGLIGLAVCWISLIASGYFVYSKSYDKSKFLISFVGTAIILVFAYLGSVFPNNHAVLFVNLLTFSLDLASISLVTGFISPDGYFTYFYYFVATALKFMTIFGFVGIIQKLTAVIRDRATTNE